MKIGELACKTRIRQSAIRYYERVGLLPAVDRVGGQRKFRLRDLRRLQFIQLAQAAGFSITEIRELMCVSNEGTAMSSTWRTFASEKKLTIQKQIEDLERVNDILDRLLRCECETLEECVSLSYPND